MFIFARCLRSLAAVTPAKYEFDIVQVTTVLIIRKKWENNGTEKIGLVTPTPGLHICGTQIGHYFVCRWPSPKWCQTITKHSIDWRVQYFSSKSLTHWGRDKMDAISQTTFLIWFPWMKMFEFRLKFHWCLFLRVQLTIFQHWFR